MSKIKITYDFLKKHDLILFECIVGSQAYATNIETSDIDKKFIYCLPEDYILGFNYLDFIEVNPDYTGWEVKRFLELIKINKPTALELLFSPEDCIVHKSPFFDEILKNKDNFLSKLALKSFTGYANQQIIKANGLDKKMNWEIERVTRKDIIDFVYVLEDQTSIPFKKWNEGKGNYYEYKFFGLSKVPKSKDTYSLYYDTGAHLCFSEKINQEIAAENKLNLIRGGLPLGLGYKGLCKSDDSTDLVKSNQLRLSSIPKGEEMLCYITFNKDGYVKHCKDYKDYQEWLEKRNVTRYVENKTHGQKIDGKNMLHAMRLIEMGIEIGSGLGLNIKRPNADYLLRIRRGDFNLKEILVEANKKLEVMNEVFNACTLPETPNYELINTLLIDIRKKVYGKASIKKHVKDVLNKVKSDYKNMETPKLNKVFNENLIQDTRNLIVKLENFINSDESLIVSPIVDFVDGLTKGLEYQVLGYTSNREMYIINSDNDRLEVYGVGLFKIIKKS